MNKIEKLIQQLCPEGVVFRELGECGKVIRGKRVTKSQLNNDKKYPVISGGFKPLGYFDEFNREPETITIAQYGSAGYLDWQNEKFWANDVCYSIYPNDGLNNRFLYFVLSSQQDLIYSLKTNAIPAHLPQSLLEKIQIPIPPLPIQQEIVTILDKFSQLEAELEAELEARSRQYEYYRNQLLAFEGKEVEWKMLGDLAKIGDGLHGTPKYSIDGNYHFINGNNLVNGSVSYFESTKKVDEIMYEKHGIDFIQNKTIFLSINGTIGSLAIYQNEKIVLGKSVAYFNIEDDILNPKFLYYYFQGKHSVNYFESQKTGSTIKNLGLKALRAFKIPVPSLQEQERIVNILDQFDALVNDIKTGLPAEIKARRAQYEYYRKKLLTFNRVTV